MLASRLGVRDVVMLFAGRGSRSRSQPCTCRSPRSRGRSPRGLRTTLAIVARALVGDFGIAAPRIGVVGLNPTPARRVARRRGSRRDRTGARRAATGAADRATGPDAAFRDLVEGRHDALVAMYHDQG